MGFLAPTAHEAAGSDLHRACLTRLRYASRLSQPPGVFFLPLPSRPCFMPVTLLGFGPPEVSPPHPPRARLRVSPLLAFFVGKG